MQVRKKYDERFKDIAERLRAIRILRPGERPQFPAVEHNLLVSVLESAVDFNPQIPQADRPSVLSRAVSDAVSQPDLTAEVLRKQLVDSERDYLRIPIKNFVLATAVGIRNYCGVKTIRVNGVHISLLQSMPPRFDRTAITDRFDEVVWNMPLHVLQILARVSARTDSAAFDQAQASLDLIRALWNLTINLGSYRLLLWGSTRPVNPILPGTVHTLHHSDGTLIEDVFWVGVQPLRNDWVYVANQEWQAIETRALSFRSALQSVSYREDIEKALIRYVRALDDADPHSSFKRLWGVLEYLTNTTAEYDTLIRRVCFLIADRERDLIRMLIEHLRDVRNAVVHGDEERTNISRYLEQVRWATERLILFHLGKNNRFKSRASAVEYLDTPTDRKLLQERLRNYRRALRRK